jgi:hypothetical protein
MPFPIPTRRSRRGLYLFGGIYTLMLIAGFEVGFQAGSSKPTSPTKSVLVASAKTNTTTARVDVTTPPPQAEPKAKPPEPKPAEPKMQEAKEPESKPIPEPPPEKKPEPKPEPKKSPPPTKGSSAVEFAKVAPVFKDKCGGCHGGANAKGGLDLRSAKSTITGGDTGEAVKPGDPDNSLLWQQIVEGKMPPKNKPKLTDDEKKLIKEWITGGAK